MNDSLMIREVNEYVFGLEFIIHPFGLGQAKVDPFSALMLCFGILRIPDSAPIMTCSKKNDHFLYAP